MAPGDDMGQKQRAWLCSGCGFLVDEFFDEPTVVAVAGERPVLGLPSGYPPTGYELAFGWAISELREQRRGWVCLLRGVMRLTEAAA